MRLVFSDEGLGLAHLMQKVSTLSLQTFEFATIALENLDCIAI